MTDDESSYSQLDSMCDIRFPVVSLYIESGEKKSDNCHMEKWQDALVQTEKIFYTVREKWMKRLKVSEQSYIEEGTWKKNWIEIENRKIERNGG